jgi:hypothetical protein
MEAWCIVLPSSSPNNIQRATSKRKGGGPNYPVVIPPYFLYIVVLQSAPRLKLRGTILLAAMLVYFLELVSLPAYCFSEPKKESNCHQNTAPKCGAAKKASSCSKKTSTKGKDSKGADCYFNCPLCYIMTLANATEPTKKGPLLLKRVYSSFQSDYLFLFYADTWKPPNHC